MQVRPTLVSKGDIDALTRGSTSTDKSTNRRAFRSTLAESANLCLRVLECAPSTPHDRDAEQASWLDVRGGGHVGRGVLRTCLRVPLQTAEDLVWCADEAKPVAVALLLRRKLLLVGRNQEPCERGIPRKIWRPARGAGATRRSSGPQSTDGHRTSQRPEPRAQRDLFASPTDHDRRPRFLHRQRIVARVLHAELLTAEAGGRWVVRRSTIWTASSSIFSAFAKQTWPRS